MSLDQFKVEHNFKYTAKEAKGTMVGFIFSLIFIIMSGAYFVNRVMLFWSHDEDSYISFDLVVDFEELGEVEYKEAKFVTGVMLGSHTPAFAKVFESEELLSQYVRVYSAQASYGA